MQKHVEILEQGVKIWNQWRKDNVNTKATLREATLHGAVLHGADLCEADLHGADLHGAVLHEATLHGADLDNTCLDFALIQFLQDFIRVSPHLPDGRRLVYRTKQSQHIGKTKYIIGNHYVADILSFSVETECHPGIYAGTLEWMLKHYPDESLVRCAVRDWHWTICAKGCIRCKELEVLADVEDVEQEHQYIQELRQADLTLGLQKGENNHGKITE